MSKPLPRSQPKPKAQPAKPKPVNKPKADFDPNPGYETLVINDVPAPVYVPDVASGRTD
jgi:hypothetical protein